MSSHEPSSPILQLNVAVDVPLGKRCAALQVTVNWRPLASIDAVALTTMGGDLQFTDKSIVEYYIFELFLD